MEQIEDLPEARLVPLSAASLPVKTRSITLNALAIFPIAATRPQLLARARGLAVKPPVNGAARPALESKGSPPRNLGHRSANGSDFVDESLARIKRSFQLSQAGICNHRFGVATHHDADRQRARNCAASKTNSMRAKMCIRFSRLAEHMSAIVVPIAQTMKIDRQYRILLKEIGLAASHEDRNIR
ncbi:hypothetical protein [Bradyrhizobium sp. 191]|uniref:hypothetical protein n=1 Tax=Bradyrhizobium sp. 191 TaxID=2782659 RepID=UPI001FFF8FA5|nr:hypothetical protein [Bradyrhizobium sp. 191]UPJ68546.1 hypothetical protein IVB23_15565 [Bradyrhizobium sp. 191]